jgi:hypothetical protein
VDCISVRWCDVHVKLGGIWVQIAFLLGFGTFIVGYLKMQKPFRLPWSFRG